MNCRGDITPADAHFPALSGADAARLLGDAVAAMFRVIFARLWIFGPFALVLHVRLNRMRRDLEALFAALARLPVPAPIHEAKPLPPVQAVEPAMRVIPRRGSSIGRARRAGVRVGARGLRRVVARCPPRVPRLVYEWYAPAPLARGDVPAVTWVAFLKNGLSGRAYPRAKCCYIESK